MALVVLQPDVAATEEDILSFCRTRLTNFFLLREMVFLPALPKGLVGKALKTELRKL